MTGVHVLSGGDHLTCERQVGAQRHVMCGNTSRDRLEILEPVVCVNMHAYFVYWFNIYSYIHMQG